MRVILLRDLPGTGRRGEAVTVPDGFARNYLIPKGLSVIATEAVISQLKQDRKKQALAEENQQARLKDLVGKLQGLRVTIPAKVNERGRLFGSVTAKTITEAVKKQGLIVQPEWLKIEKPLDTVGDFSVLAQLGPEFSSRLTVTIVDGHAA